MSEETGHFSGWAEEKEGAEKAEQEGEEETVGEIPVVGTDNWRVLMLNEDDQDLDCEQRK